MNKQKIKSIFFQLIQLAVLISTVVLVGCEKIVNIDLNDAAPVIVIYGAVSDSTGPYYVSVGQTGSYYSPAVLNPVTQAGVIISDNLGNRDTLTESNPGIYKTVHLMGVPTRTYNLSVTALGKNYSAVSAMPRHVAIDSISLIHAPSFGFGRNRGTVQYDLYCYFQDPGGRNYYRLKNILNDTAQNKRYTLFDNQYMSGERIQLSAGRVKAGDTCQIELLCIDYATYEYYLTLRDLVDQNPIFGGTPANPNTNMQNGALGDFSAWAISYRTIIINDSLINTIP